MQVRSQSSQCDSAIALSYSARYNDAINAYNKCLEEIKKSGTGDMAAAMINRAFCYQKIGDHKKAKLDINNALNLKHNDPDWIKHKANYFFNLNQFDSAHYYIDYVIKNAKAKYYPTVYKANYFQTEGKNVLAKKQYLDAIKLDSSNSYAYTAMGTLSYRENNEAEAMSWFNKSIQKAIFGDSSHFYRASIYKKNGAFAEAIKDLDFFINPNLSEEIARLMRAECNLYLGNKAMANKDLDYVYAKNSNSKQYAKVLIIAAILAQPRNKKTSISSSKTVQQLYNRSEQLLLERRLSESFAKIDSAIQREPNNAHLYILNAEIIYYIINEDLKDELEKVGFDITKDEYWQLAINDLNGSIKINKNNWDAYYWRAAYYLLAKNKTKAKLDIQKALELKPNEPDALSLLKSLEREQ